jgi:copper chaperone CopZ
MKLVSKLMLATILLFSIITKAQIKNSKTETVKVYGNCEMCKAKIEKAGNLKKTSKVTWDDKTQLATITYDEKKTNQDEILKRIALVGYDSEKFLAPDATYSKLDKCCQYERVAKVSENIIQENIAVKDVKISSNNATNSENQLQPIFENYFLLKDALVKTNGKEGSEKAKIVLTSISAVKMETLKTDEHMTWMKVYQNLTNDAKTISDTQDVEKQRSVFNSLSKGIYELIKVSKPTEAIYYQYCPMKKMNWLSKENTIKNPYFGSQMLTCGSVVETIK